MLNKQIYLFKIKGQTNKQTNNTTEKEVHVGIVYVQLVPLEKTQEVVYSTGHEWTILIQHTHTYIWTYYTRDIIEFKLSEAFHFS